MSELAQFRWPDLNDFRFFLCFYVIESVLLETNFQAHLYKLYFSLLFIFYQLFYNLTIKNLSRDLRNTLMSR